MNVKTPTLEYHIISTMFPNTQISTPMQKPPHKKYAADCVKRRAAGRRNGKIARSEGKRAADEEASGLATTDDSLSRSLIVEPPAAA